MHLGGSVRVGADRDPVGALDERDGAAEAPERLRELEPDRARAQHEQRARQLGQPERSGAVEPRHLVDALDRRHGRARSRGDEDPLAGEQPVAHPHGGRVDELRRSVHQRDAEVGEALPPRLLRPHEPVRARLQRGQVEGDGTGADTQVCGRAQAREQLGGGDVLLRRLAGDVGAGAAPEPVLDDGDPRAVVDAGARRRLAARAAGADDDQVEAAGRHAALSPRRQGRYACSAVSAATPHAIATTPATCTRDSRSWKRK